MQIQRDYIQSDPNYMTLGKKETTTESVVSVSDSGWGHKIDMNRW